MNNGSRKMTHEERTTMEIEMDDLDRVEWELAEDENDDEEVRRRKRRVATGDLYEAARAGDTERVRELLHEGSQDVNARDRWDSTALYYSCLAGHADVARLLLENGAICAEHTFDGDRCHYAALNLRIRRLLKSFEARPPPLPPLPAALRNVFLSCASNHPDFGRSGSTGVDTDYFAPDMTFYITGRPIEAHRAILIARSPYFKMKFETDWKYRREVRFSNRKLSYVALYSLIHFFYSDRLDIAVDDMEDLVRVCKICRCDGLKNALEKEIMHQRYAEYKSVKNDDDSQKRFILQGTSLPEEERLPFAMKRLLELSLDRSSGWGNNVNSSGKILHSYCYDDPCFDKEKNLKEYQKDADNKETLNESDIFSDIRHLFTEKNEVNFDMAEGRNDGMELYSSRYDNKKDFDDHADICFLVEGKIFRSHQVILASRSEYFKARLSRASDFREGKAGRHNGSLLLLEEHDLSAEAFEKLLEYMYTDSVNHVDLFQAEEMFDVASRYLVFPLKRAVADALLPQLQNVTPAELCQWLMLADLYGVWKIKEYCLDLMAFNFEQFASLSEFHKMLLSLPPPSGDSSQRTTVPSAPGEEEKSNDSNILDDLREKWLEAEAAELDQRDESARQFDKMLEILIQQAKYESQQNEI